jgi:hypothetical protein
MEGSPMPPKQRLQQRDTSKTGQRVHQRTVPNVGVLRRLIARR